MDAPADIRAAVTIAALYAIGALAYAWLPPVDMPAFIAFLLPTAAAGIYLLMRRLYVRDLLRSDNGAFAATYGAIVFRVVLFVGGLHCTIVLALLGRGIFARTGPVVPRLTPILLGLLLISVGNLLPRVKPNLAIGIRTSRTLTDRPAWLRVNRVAGYVAVALGAVVVAAGLLMPRGPLVAGTIGVAGMVAIVIIAAATQRLTHASAE
jgi:uncharacterized membrane protein